MIVAGATAYPRIIDPEPFRAIADEVGAYFVFDAAHIAGLVAGGVHPSPGAVRRRGHPHHPQDPPRPPRRVHPRQGGVRGGDRQGPVPRACRAVRSSTSSRPRRWPSARRRSPSSATTPRQIVANAQALARALAERGFRLVSGGSDNHLMLVDLRAVRRRAHRQAGPGDARPRRHHPQPQHDPRRPPPAVRHERPAHRDAGGDDRGHEGAGDGGDRRPDRPRPGRRGGARRCATTWPILCSKFPPYTV